MNDQDSSKCPECPEIDKERSIIVVSDLHLGSEKGQRTSEDFASFLNWLKSDGEKKVEVKRNSYKILKPPQLLILLGDILELWRPRPPLRNELFKDYLPLVYELLDLPIDIVYVIGNHDREIYEIHGRYLPSIKNQKNIIIEPDQYPCKKDPCRKINPKGLKLGSWEFTFLHGHQFDTSFKLSGLFSEYPGWVCNNSSLFEAHPWARRTFWGLLSFGIFGIAFIFLLSRIFLYFVPSIVYSFILVMVGMSIPLCIISIPSEKISSFYNFVSNNPIFKKLLIVLDRHTSKAKWKRIDELKARREFKRKIDEGDVDTVVFGHTHIPADNDDPVEKKRFMNTGSWINEEPGFIALEKGPRYHITGKDKESIHDNEHYYRKFVYNTFIYIDDQGPFFLIWDTEDSLKPVARHLEIKSPDKEITNGKSSILSKLSEKWSGLSDKVREYRIERCEKSKRRQK